MRSFLKIFLEIALLRQGPQALPASTVLAVLTFIAYGLSSLAITLIDLPFARALLLALVDGALLYGLTYLLLWIRQLGGRFRQTASAMGGASTLIALVAWPLFAWRHQVGEELAAVVTPSLLLLVVMGWNLAVIANAIRHALTTTMMVAAPLAMLYFYVTFRVLGALLPATGQG